MSISINDVSDKGYGERVNEKKFKYEVGVYHKENDTNEIPEIFAKFKRYDDAKFYAKQLSLCFYFKEIIIRGGK